MRRVEGCYTPGVVRVARLWVLFAVLLGITGAPVAHVAPAAAATVDRGGTADARPLASLQASDGGAPLVSEPRPTSSSPSATWAAIPPSRPPLDLRAIAARAADAPAPAASHAPLVLLPRAPRAPPSASA